MSELLAWVGGTGTVGTLCRTAVILTVIIGGFIRTNGKVGHARRSADLAASRVKPIANGYTARSEAALERIERKIDEHTAAHATADLLRPPARPGRRL